METLVEPTRARLNLMRGRYRTWLCRANDIDCLTQLWAIQALQSGNERQAARYINFPKEVVTKDMSNENAIYKWELETIVTSLLTIPKDKARVGKYHFTNCTHFGSLGSLVNYLRDIETCEYANTAIPAEVLEELYRIGQRQFSWQRGFNSEQLYRHAFMYGQGECGAFFQETNGLTVSDFMQMSMVMFGLLMETPWARMPDARQADLSQDHLVTTVRLHSLDLDAARARATELNREASAKINAPLRTAYQPSILREHPMITKTTRGYGIIAPLPPLVMNRATAGLFFDMRRGPKRLLTEANNRFEEYVRKLVKGYRDRFEMLGSSRYGPKKAQFDTPDCMAMDEGEIKVVIECKATKLTFEAQFAENPMIAAKDGFEQLAWGIFQLWRFFSHVRRGIFSEYPVSATAHGVVLTMEGWMQMANKLRLGALARAREYAAEKDPEITEEDMRMVVFASVQELNDTLCETTEDSFLEALRLAATPDWEGYGLIEMAREAKVTGARRSYPLDMGEVLPWFPEIEERYERRLNAMRR